MANQVADLPEPWRDLNGKVVMVTGASSGIGREFCLDLAKAGCRIVAAARRVDRLKSLCDDINSSSSSPRAVAVELDVSADGATFERSVHEAWQPFGRIDALVNNAGTERMRDANQGGSVINISSVAGLNRIQLPGACAYASSKAGLIAMTKVMAVELGVYKIRVNSISPGLFRSEITEDLMQG